MVENQELNPLFDRDSVTDAAHKSHASCVAAFLNLEGVRGIARVAYTSYRQFLVTTASGQSLANLANGSQSPIWGTLRYQEFMAAAEEADCSAGINNILPVRALMAARMAQANDCDLACGLGLAKEILHNSPIEQPVLDSLSSRWTMDYVVSLTTTPEAALVVYTASTLALVSSSHQYLRSMARALHIPTTLPEFIHSQIADELKRQQQHC